jgi:uncharacterized protein (DUF1499 family)
MNPMHTTPSTRSPSLTAAFWPGTLQPLRRALALAATAALLTGCAVAQAPADAPAEVSPLARLACSAMPNCVNSVAAGGLPPLRYEGTAEQGMAQLRATLAAFEEARIESADALSLTAIFTTRIGFRDEVEFVLDPAGQQIHFRSRSRLGLYDFGKNRSRMQAVSERFVQALPR